MSATKDEVHDAIKRLDKGLLPNAFCKILPDIGANDPDFCTILHADTAGTKASLAYIYWRETGDLSVWKGIAQDAMVMNLDDMGCVGCVDHFLISNTITRNKHCIPGEVLSAIINGTIEFCDRMRDLGITIHHAGGETADVGDIVRTIDVGFTAFGRMPRRQVLVNDILEGDVIVGLSSAGRATYEDAYNSGIGSNGLTSARHDVLEKSYATRYPESFDPATSDKYVYSGSRRVDELISIDGEQHTVGKLLLSPTRTFLPVLREIMAGYGDQVRGLIHCTGGGQTKVSK
ncbi:MAG: phosphoribosylformylglycinamidine cyclo-ligase, partial [Saprospiraceae bacterium]|nr:phosphoribosylformylglycinamidine cyclo-ligase [Saprospiraceae bacterium]